MSCLAVEYRDPKESRGRPENDAPEYRATALLTDRYAEFLRFVERRTGDRDLACEILHTAYVSALEHMAELKDERKAVPWFYRILRNRVAFHYRRQALERRVQERWGPVLAEVRCHQEPSHERICRCAIGLIEGLKPEYAFLLRQVDLGDRDPSEVAGELGITPNNARVRLHRARRALRRELLGHCHACSPRDLWYCACEGGGSPVRL